MSVASTSAHGGYSLLEVAALTAFSPIGCDINTLSLLNDFDTISDGCDFNDFKFTLSDKIFLSEMPKHDQFSTVRCCFCSRLFKMQSVKEHMVQRHPDIPLSVELLEQLRDYPAAATVLQHSRSTTAVTCQTSRGQQNYVTSSRANNCSTAAHCVSTATTTSTSSTSGNNVGARIGKYTQSSKKIRLKLARTGPATHRVVSARRIPSRDPPPPALIPASTPADPTLITSSQRSGYRRRRRLVESGVRAASKQKVEEPLGALISLPADDYLTDHLAELLQEFEQSSAPHDSVTGVTRACPVSVASTVVSVCDGVTSQHPAALSDRHSTASCQLRAQVSQVSAAKRQCTVAPTSGTVTAHYQSTTTSLSPLCATSSYTVAAASSHPHTLCQYNQRLNATGSGYHGDRSADTNSPATERAIDPRVQCAVWLQGGAGQCPHSLGCSRHTYKQKQQVRRPQPLRQLLLAARFSRTNTNTVRPLSLRYKPNIVSATLHQTATLLESPETRFRSSLDPRTGAVTYHDISNHRAAKPPSPAVSTAPPRCVTPTQHSKLASVQSDRSQCCRNVSVIRAETADTCVTARLDASCYSLSSPSHPTAESAHRRLLQHPRPLAVCSSVLADRLLVASRAHVRQLRDAFQSLLSDRTTAAAAETTSGGTFKRERDLYIRHTDSPLIGQSLPLKHTLAPPSVHLGVSRADHISARHTRYNGHLTPSSPLSCFPPPTH